MYEKFSNCSLDELKSKKKAVEQRIILAKNNLGPTAQTASATLLELQREDAALANLIASWIPHDFTPNPGGTSGAPMIALAHA
jgi:hypothetical protein